MTVTMSFIYGWDFLVVWYLQALRDTVVLVKSESL